MKESSSLLLGFVDSFTWLLHCYCPICLVRLVSSLRSFQRLSDRDRFIFIINQKFILTLYHTNLHFQFKSIIGIFKG